MTPINGGRDGWRSECVTHGTVLKCHATKREARWFAGWHRCNPTVGPW